MGAYAGPDIVENGLVLALDAGNSKSYPGSGTTWTDLSGLGNNGTLENGVGYNSANGGSLDFDGVDDYVYHAISGLTAVHNITNTSPFTFSSIFKLNAYPAALQPVPTTGILMKGDYNPSYGLNLAYSGDSGGVWTEARVRYGLRNLLGTPGVTPGYGLIFIDSNLLLSLNEWYRVDMTHEFSGTTHSLKLYINGSLDRQDDLTDSLYPINFQNSSVLGTNYYILRGNRVFADMNVAAHYIYNRALTASEVQQNYNATRSRYGV